MTMDIYSHVLPTMQQDAMDKLNQAFIGNIADNPKEDEGDSDDTGGVLASI
jgi:hypothetical protein